jgi:hypothetical protein
MTPSLIDSFQKMAIHKGDTFHTLPSTNDLWDPLEKQSQFVRSTTCPKSLEDLMIGAGERRVAEMLQRVDKAIATQSKLALGAVLNEPEVLPVPTFMLNQTSLQGESATTRARLHRNSHSSDSGIGSSIAESDDAKPTGEQLHAPPSTLNTLTFICLVLETRQSLDLPAQERGLSKYACEQIFKHIVKPILAEKNLKEFHPLIKDIPSRIGDKEIQNLRELEKSLIFLAPVSARRCLSSDCAFAHGCFGVQDYSPSPTKYLRFCERTIRVLHTTVTTLHESDQRAPTDRPYTQGYFVDLVEQVRWDTLHRSKRGIDIVLQIRRYAMILAATREKQERGEQLGEMDATA